LHVTLLDKPALQEVDQDEFIAFASKKDKNGASVVEGTLEWLESLVYGDLFLSARARRVFAKLDLDGDGSLTPSELVTLLRASGASEKEALATALKILDLADKNMDRQVSCEEFVWFVHREEAALGQSAEDTLAWFESLVFAAQFLETRARRVFKKIDLNGDGSLTHNELVRCSFCALVHIGSEIDF
jgi:Ca2+-binding EF-hand superfamily protein